MYIPPLGLKVFLPIFVVKFVLHQNQIITFNLMKINISLEIQNNILLTLEKTINLSQV